MELLLRTSAVEIDRGSPAPLKGFLAAPARQGPAPAVVVIHEIFGLNDDIRGTTRRLADAGYVAVAVDLFSGGNRAACMLSVIGGMLSRRIDSAPVRSLQAVVEWIKRRPEADAERIGVIGFCMGGGYALLLACADDDIRAASVFYGMNPRPLSVVAAACPVVGSYPEKDFTRKAAVALESAVAGYGVPHDLKVYPGTRHGFFSAGRDVFAPEAAEDAWARTLGFFNAHMGP